MSRWMAFTLVSLRVALADAGLDARAVSAAPLAVTQITNSSNCDNILFFNGGALDGDGLRVAFASNCNLTGQNADGNYEIYRFDAATNTLSQVTNTSGCSNGFSDTFRSGVISADGTRIAFLSECNLTGQNPDGNPEIFRYDATANSFMQITDSTGCQNGYPSLNGDGTRFAFGSECDLTGQNPDRNFEIYRFDLGTDTLTQVTNSSDCGSVLTSISADGNRISFSSTCNHTGDNADGNEEIFLFDANTDALTQVTNTSGCSNGSGSTFGWGTIDAAGTRLAFPSDCNLTGQNADGNGEIYLFDTTTSMLTQLTTSSDCVLGPPSLNTGGTLVTLSSSCNLSGQNTDGNFEIYRVDVATKAATQITSSSGCDSVFSSSNADGARLAFPSSCDLTGCNTDGNTEIFLASSATSTGGGGDGCQLDAPRGGTAWLLLIPAVGLPAIRRRKRGTRSA